jgi:VWFA-related protein
MLLSLLFPAASTALAQQPYIETFEVRLHNLDVVVTDAQGNPVRGLTKDDFLVLEDGKPQNITNFSTYDLTSTTATSSAGAPGSQPGPLSPETTSTPPRRFVFFVDDMAMQAPARKKLKEQAQQLVRGMRAGDLATIVRPTGAERLALGFTGDATLVERKLGEAIDTLTMRIDAPGLREQIQLRRELENTRHDLDNESALLGGKDAEGLERKAAKARYADITRDRVEQRLGQLRAVIGSLAGLEGRKVLVVISSGWSAHPGREAYTYWEQTRTGGASPEDAQNSNWTGFTDLTPQIDDIARAAASRGVTIYALEPEVPVAINISRTVSGRPKGSTYDGGDASVEQTMPPEMLSELLTHTATTLTSLTEKTGGKWFRGDANIDDAFRQVTGDLSLYYSLAYRASGERDKPRRVVVQVRNRPELRVRTRGEVMERSTEREMADLVASSLIFPRNVNELEMQVTTGTPKRDGVGVLIPLEIVIPLANLTFLPTGETYIATFDLHYIAAGIDRDFATSGKQQQRVELTADQFVDRETANYRFKTAIQAVPGRVRIALGVLDPVSNLSALQVVNTRAE